MVEMAPVETDANLFLFQKGNFLFRHHNGGNYSLAPKTYPFFLLLFVFSSVLAMFFPRDTVVTIASCLLSDP